MVYQALYRKYRPQNFTDMVGQEVVATTLKNAIINNQISHAYLFSGPRGTGKTSAAKIFAKAINCLNPIDGEPDNTCEICQAINNGSLEDVIELDAASNNGVDEIREIRDKSTYAATRAKYKVYIIDEVHMLSTGAFNALLKTLEEPTANVVFILATTELQKIPATIISRVQRFAFKAITTVDIRAHLAEVLTDENFSYDESALDIIAKAAEGGMRDALSLLDQALSFSDGKQLTENDALLVTGAIAEEALVSYVAAIAAVDSRTALENLNKIFAEGKNMLRFAEDLLGYFRDQLLAETSNFSHAQLYRWIDIVIASMKTLRETTQTKIAADVMTMQLTEPVEAAIQATSVMSTVKESQPEKEAISAASIAPSSPQRQSVAAAPPLSAEVSPSSAATTARSTAVSLSQARLLEILMNEAKKEIKQQVEAAWPNVTAAFESPRDAALLKIAKVEAASRDAVILSVEHENLATIITGNAELTARVSLLLKDATGLDLQLHAITKENWQSAVAAFMAQRQGKSVVTSEPTDKNLSADVPLPEEPLDFPSVEPQGEDALTAAKNLFGGKVTSVED